MKSLQLLGVAMLFSTLGSAHANPLEGLRDTHPRIFAHEADFDRIAELITTDELAGTWWRALKERGEKVLAEPVAVYELRDGRRLLYVSREVLNRTLTLAMLQRVDPDPRYLERLWQDMEAVAAFPHWNPDHFLDVGEMSLAVAIAYDWLYDQWTPKQRATIRAGLLTHGIEEGLAAYEKEMWWTKADMNWNQVCNGGLIAASLALGDEHPERAASLLEKAVASLPLAMQRYNPQGGYDEGAGYWKYGTSYNVYAIAALQSALGHEFGLGDTPGFDITGDFVFHMTGPTGGVFNFADATGSRVVSPIFLYLAKRYDQPAYARYAARHNRGEALDLLWYDPRFLEKPIRTLPLSVKYDDAGVVTMRTGWDDPDALFVGVKGGDNGKPHGQLDLGSFILEADGVRWFIDLGRDDYNLPGYFSDKPDGQRWTYYRNRGEGHNTAVLNSADREGPDQNWHTQAPIQLEDHIATVDLSAVYGSTFTRHVEFNAENRSVTVTDVCESETPTDYWWFGHTNAKVSLSADGRTATLHQRGKSFTATIIQPDHARFEVMDARPLPGSPDPPGQHPNNGATITNRSRGHFVQRGEIPVYGEPNPNRATRKLAVHLQETGPFTTIIRLTPGPPATPPSTK